MTRPRRLAACSVVALAGLAACGKKGPPLPPVRPVPAAVADLQARRAGELVWLTFTVPDRNQDGSRPADLARVDVFGLTVDPTSREPTPAEFLERAVLVASIEVQPPAQPGEAPPAAGPGDERPVQGGVVTVEETLTPEHYVPVRFEPKPPGPGAAGGALGRPEPARTYVAVAVSGRRRRSAPSGRVQVSLRPPPPAPADVELTYTEQAFTIRWRTPPPDPWRPVWPVLGYAFGFNVYELPGDQAGRLPRTPVNPTPVSGPSLEVPLLAFGVPRCFGVRAVESLGGRVVESELSRPVCATPVDTFAPAAPTGLVAVAEAGAINLSWNPNSERDLAGYLVLRGEAPGATLRQITPAPLREPTYRDTSVRAGVRYVYAVVAVDGATPPNVSAQSARVEETAR